MPCKTSAYRKLAYLANLETKDKDAVLVSLADKTHNAWSMLRELDRKENKAIAMFTTRAWWQRWKLQAVDHVFSERVADTVVYLRWKEAQERLVERFADADRQECECEPQCVDLGAQEPIRSPG